jgi:[methyl-Co(III) methanol-specific corrinoid protein]:coenzyme M methyltransferase
LEYQQRQVEALEVPSILHICGNVDKILPFMNETGCAALSVEPKADVREARRIVGSEGVLMGGVDTATTLFMKGPEEVREGSVEQIELGLDILAPGCAIAPGTPTENLLEMVKVARSIKYQ